MQVQNRLLFPLNSKQSKQETAQAKEQLARVENRHKDIKRLEEGITEIHSMFMDLAVLVEQQGEMVSRIEDHINSKSMIVIFLVLCHLGTTSNLTNICLGSPFQSFQLPVWMWKRDEKTLGKQKTCKSQLGKRR